MHFILGLGNPGAKYRNTRHNLGFLFLDYLASRLNLTFEYKEKFKACFAHDSSLDLALIRPDTFMNNSGLAVHKLFEFYKIANSQKSAEYNYPNLGVIHDDLDIPLGDYRLQYGRGAAGHNGVKSILEHLHTNRFWRCRIGIQCSSLRIPVEQFVLSDFSSSDLEELQTLFAKIYPQLFEKLKLPTTSDKHILH